MADTNLLGQARALLAALAWAFALVLATLLLREPFTVPRASPASCS